MFPKHDLRLCRVLVIQAWSEGLDSAGGRGLPNCPPICSLSSPVQTRLGRKGLTWTRVKGRDVDTPKVGGGKLWGEQSRLGFATL